MTIKQKQLILCCFDLMDPADVDGIPGPQTEAATRKLQQGLGITQDGVFGDGTLTAALDRLRSGEPLEATVSKTETAAEESSAVDIFWDEIEYFSREEFRCQCKGKYCDGFPEEPEEELVRVCNEIRRRLGVPVQIVDAGGSGVRCPRHNAAVGGVANSNHLYGKAADLHSEKSPQEMYRVAEEVLGNTGELGLYDWGIHVGVNCTYSRYRG